MENTYVPTFIKVICNSNLNELLQRTVKVGTYYEKKSERRKNMRRKLIQKCNQRVDTP